MHKIGAVNSQILTDHTSLRYTEDAGLTKPESIHCLGNIICHISDGDTLVNVRSAVEEIDRKILCKNAVHIGKRQCRPLNTHSFE